MIVSNPKRTAFQTLSQEHKQAQLLCQRIREGIRLQIEPIRIMRYAEWYFLNHLAMHFEFEQKYIFPVLGKDNVQVKKALSTQRRLTRLFTNNALIDKRLSGIEEDLDFLVRFEEKNLFDEVKNKMTTAQRKELQVLEPEPNTTEWDDCFWLT